MTKRLCAVDRRLIRSGSSDVVAESLAELSRFFPRDRWLASANVYAHNAVARIKNDVERAKRPPVDRDLRHYIAASTVTHCADGWSFIGRSIDSALRGDIGTCCHLAYYAELRAAASLLACEGIGVFDMYHFVVDAQGKCGRFSERRGTHKQMWLALSYWMELQNSKDLLANIVAPGRVPIQALLSQFGHETPAADLVLNKWLKQWGLDLYRLHHDRAIRNVVSYRPTALLLASGESDVSRDVQRIASFWRLLEPRETPFEALDRAVTFSGSVELFVGQHGILPSQAPETYSAAVDYMLGHVELPSEAWATDMQHYLVESAHGGAIPSLLEEAALSDVAGASGQHLQVIARALLLLRLATGACAGLLEAANVDRESLRFWWRTLGFGKGLWPTQDFDGDFGDLWSDIDEELARLTDWAAAEQRTILALRALPSQPVGLEPPVSLLGSLERALLWGIAL